MDRRVVNINHIQAMYPCIVTILLSSKSLTELDNPMYTKKNFTGSPPTHSEKQTTEEGCRKPQMSTIRFISQYSSTGPDSPAASQVDGDMEAGGLAR